MPAIQYYQCPECGHITDDRWLTERDEGMFCECGVDVWFQPNTGRTIMVPCDAPPPAPRESFTRKEMIDAVHFGFNCSGEGWNGEYPGDSGTDEDVDACAATFLAALDN